MNLEHIYYVGEIIGVVVIILSLIYVGQQVRQNTQAIQVSSTQSFTDTWITFTSNLSQSPHLADILHRGLSEGSSLKGAEIVQFYAFLGQAFAAYQSFYFQWKRGVLDNGLWSSYRHAISDVLTNPGAAKWWQFRHHWYVQEFQDHVEKAVLQEPRHPMYPDLPET